jgi:hypothetical protein
VFALSLGTVLHFAAIILPTQEVWFSRLATARHCVAYNEQYKTREKYQTTDNKLNTKYIIHNSKEIHRDIGWKDLTHTHLMNYLVHRATKLYKSV